MKSSSDQDRVKDGWHETGKNTDDGVNVTIKTS